MPTAHCISGNQYVLTTRKKKPMTEHTPELPPIKIAFVIDGKVVDVLHCDDRLAAIFLSDPVILDITERVNSSENGNFVNATWDGTTLTQVDNVVPDPDQTPPSEIGTTVG